jgi:hypothetical protein
VNIAHHEKPPRAARKRLTYSNLSFATLAFKTPLEFALFLVSDIEAALSGPYSKAMTYCLRCRDATIFVGVSIATAEPNMYSCESKGVLKPDLNHMHPH